MRFSRCIALPAVLCALLAACGGGGGGSGSSSSGGPVNTTPPTATISSVAPAQRVTNQPVTFTGAGTTVTNGALTYAWNFGDGTTGSGASTTHNYAMHGNYTVTLTVRDAGGLTTTASQSISLLAPPATPAVMVQPGARTPNATIQLSATATDPQGSSLTYTWDFGDGGSSTGTDVTHAFATAGTFAVRVTATNALGLTATSAATQVPIAWLPLVRPSLIVLNPGHLAGHTLFATAAFLEPNGLPFTLEYTFGDSASTSTTDGNATVHHTYATPGSYTVRVIATSAAGQVTSEARAVSVQAPGASPTLADNVMQPYCAGPFCAAVDATTYAGRGVGVWRFHNSTGSAATVNVSLSGLHAGLATTLVFSNGRATAASSAPSPGTMSVLNQKLAAHEATELAHERMQEANQRIAAGITRVYVPPTAAKLTRAAMQAAAPPIGATRTWREAFSGQTYDLTVAATCAFSTGRNGVIWVDSGQLQRGELAGQRVSNLRGTLCGAGGAYERLVALTGDVWGPAAASAPTFIQDGADLQDLNIVIPGVAQVYDFGGYFSAGNLVNTTADPASNAALSVTLNGWVFANYPDDDPALRSILIHELKHLANFYQRAIARNAYHSTFLEETSAMLAEDLISPLTTTWNRTEARISGYISSAGGIGLTGWTHPAGQSYNLGGSFGAFLHRRYGASLDRELLTMCIDNGSPQSSYDCVDQFIIRHGGVGFEDEFARMGASTLGILAPRNLPAGFGFPGIIVEDVPLKATGYFMHEGPFNQPPADLNGQFGATTQAFLRDYIDAGQTTFHRNNVVVPAHTTLLVVVSDPES
jgi:PKD repeat protein